jgi:hypothetical protein
LLPEAGIFGPVGGDRKAFNSDAIKPLIQLRISKKIMFAICIVRPIGLTQERLLYPGATALERYRYSSGDHQTALIVLKCDVQKGPMPGIRPFFLSEAAPSVL